MRTVLGLILVLALATLMAEAAQPHKTPEQLRSYATHIVTGKVGLIFERTRQSGHYKYVQYVAEVTVGAVEKGEGLRPGDLVYARYWTKGFTGPGYPTPGGGGQTDILPKEGERMRFYVALGKGEGVRDTTDKGYEVINPNGFERLAPARSE